ncbi:MAG: response regulator [Clostridia bacterium]|nr:response regulator [Clostridia bacterium]
MTVYILDIQSKARNKIIKWLSEDKAVENVKIFDDYIKFIELVSKCPADFCIIRLGENRIPGLKVACMVQQISADIRIVFVSNESDYAIDAYEIGAYGYLLCPVNRDTFEKCLGRRT